MNQINHVSNKTLIDKIQLNYKNIPLAVFLIGANGSGKSTLRNYLNLSDIQTNIDPDVLNRIYKERYPQNYLIEAAKEALNMYQHGIDRGFNVCIESTLAGHGTIERIIKAKNKGYFNIAYFVGLNDVELNLARIKSRVLAGGHNIPESKVRKRYIESMTNLANVISYFDELYVIDNSQDAYNLQFSIQDKKLVQNSSNIESWSSDIIKQIYSK